jgi:ketosteroid isomerase-like protein
VTVPTQRDVDEIKIQQQIDTLVERIQARDLKGLMELYTSDIVSFDIPQPLQHVGVEAKSKNWAEALATFERVNYEVRALTLTVGDDVAFGHCINRLSGTMKDGTATAGIWVRCTYCFRKIGDNWLIAHDQVSVPIDFESGRGILDLEP